MKKHLVNIAWAIITIPFYLLILICCIYSRCLLGLFKGTGEKVEPYQWIDDLDTWVYKMKNKHL